MSQYYYAPAGDAGPQTIPPGFGGLHDWDAVDDAERARRGWVAALPPAIDPAFERVAVAFAQGEDGVWSASYEVVPGDVERARTEARTRVADRRWQAEVGGMAFGGAAVATDRETQAKLTAAYLKALAVPEFAIANWKAAEGMFVTLDHAQIIALGDAMTAHVQGCFDREATLNGAIAAAADAPAVVAVLSGLDAGLARVIAERPGRAG